MRTVNIRQLKTNPSTALAAAREDDMVVVMNRDTPQALLVDLEQLGVPDLPAVRVALAGASFWCGSVSQVSPRAWPASRWPRCSPCCPARVSRSLARARPPPKKPARTCSVRVTG